MVVHVAGDRRCQHRVAGQRVGEPVTDRAYSCQRRHGRQLTGFRYLPGLSVGVRRVPGPAIGIRGLAGPALVARVASVVTSLVRPVAAAAALRSVTIAAFSVVTVAALVVVLAVVTVATAAAVGVVVGAGAGAGACAVAVGGAGAGEVGGFVADPLGFGVVGAAHFSEDGQGDVEAYLGFAAAAVGEQPGFEQTAEGFAEGVVAALGGGAGVFGAGFDGQGVDDLFGQGGDVAGEVGVEPADSAECFAEGEA